MEVRLLRADQVRALDGDSPGLPQIVDWCEHFLAGPSPLLGRKGNVCPFMPEALARGAVLFALVRLEKRGLAAVPEIEELVDASRDHFLWLEKRRGQHDTHRSFVMVLPDIAPEEAPAVIDPLQRRLRSTFVREGLMLGEFHPFSKMPGLRNPGFRPLRSLVPFLAIRHMVESDIDFLIAPSDSPETRLRSIEAYLKFLGPSLSLANQAKASQALRSTRAEIESFK